MKQIEVKVRYMFDGHYMVRAASEADATRIVSECCGATLGGGIHTTLDEVTCPGWKFPTHSEMQILSIKDKHDGTI